MIVTECFSYMFYYFMFYCFKKCILKSIQNIFTIYYLVAKNLKNLLSKFVKKNNDTFSFVSEFAPFCGALRYYVTAAHSDSYI